MVVKTTKEEGDPFDTFESINGSTAAGTVLRDGTLYTVAGDNVVISGASGHTSALVVEEAAVTVLYIPEGRKLTVTGGSGSGGSTRACAGIRLPAGSTLVVCGEGTLVAAGGAADGCAAPAGIGCGGAASSGKSSGAAGIGGNGLLSGDASAVQAGMGKLVVLGSVSVTATPGSTDSAASAGGDPGLLSTSEAIVPNVSGRSPDTHADTHWSVYYDVTIRDEDGTEQTASKATLSMYYDPISPPIREEMMFLGCTNNVNKFVYGPLGGGQINPCRTVGPHDVYAVWIYGVNVTDDPEIKDIRFDDDIVSLREIIYRISQEMRGRPLPCPFPVPISPKLASWDDSTPLVFTLRDEPLRPALEAATPVLIDGRFARGRPMIIDGGGDRTTPLFSVTNGMGLVLQNVTLRNARWKNTVAHHDGLAVQAEKANTSLVVSNVLFSSVKAGASGSCVLANGRTRVLQTSWESCTGCPIAMGQQGAQAILAESTVVPSGSDTLPVSVGASGAVMACTIPSGVNAASGAKVVGSITEPITEAMCDPVTALSTNLYKVTQYYYRVIPANRDLVGSGKGCYIWHDADWTNVAYSDRPFDTRTAIFGDAAKTDTVHTYDVRGVLIQYLWNTRGSYAISWSTPPLVVNTAEDQSLDDMNLTDATVSLREALRIIQVIPTIRNPDGTPNKITFSDELFANSEKSAKIRLNYKTLTVKQLAHITDIAPVWICGPDGGRKLTIDGICEIDDTQSRILDLQAGVHARVSDVIFTYGQSAGNAGAAITSHGALHALERCTFTGNKGTAVWVDQDPLVVSGCTFSENGDSSMDGGAIHQYNNYYNGTGTVTVVDSVFERNTAHVGGAICSRGGLQVSGSIFGENKMTTSDDWGGGAIWNKTAAPVAITTSVFERNESKRDGGAIRLEGTNGLVTIERSTFTKNAAEVDGGAVSTQRPLQLTSTTFEGNSASGSGGAVWAKDLALTIGKCRFEGNAATARGGAVRAQGAGDPIHIEETTFDGNQAKANDGGALSCEGSASGRQLEILNATFIDNRAQMGGGAICQAGCDAILANVTFRGNSTVTGSGGAYRGCATAKEHVSVINVIASGNTAAADSTTADFAPGNSSIFTGYASAIKAIKDVATDSGRLFLTGGAASESTIFKYSAAKKDERVDVANGTKQTGERLRTNYSYVHHGASIAHDAAWTNVICTFSGTAVQYVLRGCADLAKEIVESDITGRTYEQNQMPCMGSLWDVEDPPSKTVSTLKDIEDAYDGRTSLREVVENLKTSQTWRDLLYNANLRAYEVNFAPGLTGTLSLSCALQIPALDGTPVFVRVPGSLQLTIDGGNASRAFEIESGGTLDLANLTIANCRGMVYGTSDYDGGAILNAGTLNVSNVAFVACTAGPTNTAPSGKGGAVHSKAGTVTRLWNCSFSGCTAARGGALSVAENSLLTIANATFVSNAVNNTGYLSVSRGNAVYLAGKTTDALFAHCTFACNVGQDHAGTGGGGAVYIDNCDTEDARVSFVNSILVGNGPCDLATSGRVRLVGSIYGNRTAVSSSSDPWCEDYSRYVTKAVSTVDVYAHTAADGTPETRTMASGSVRHVYLPLAYGSVLPSVYLRTDWDWSIVGWASPTEPDTFYSFRGASFLVRSVNRWMQDLLGTTMETNWVGAVGVRESKTQGEPEPSGHESGVVTEATYENFAATVLSAIAGGVSDDVIITMAENVKGKTIYFDETIKLDVPRHVTIRGPITLDGRDSTRFFTVEPGVKLTLVDVTLQNGCMVSGSGVWGSLGGAILLHGTSYGSKLASLEAYDCTFKGCKAAAGGVVYANELGCSETFVRCTFSDNESTEGYGAAIYHDDMNLTLTETSIDLNDIWPRPAVAVQLASGALAMYADANGSQSAAALKSVAALAATDAAARGNAASVQYLTFTAAQAVGGESAVVAMTPVAQNLELTTSEGDGQSVTLMPENVVPYMWYALEHAESPVGPYTVEADGWVQANPDGTLPKALTAPADGTSGFYRIVVRE